MTEELDKLCDSFDTLEKKFSEERRELVERAGEKMYQKVLRNIDATTKKSTGKLRDACYKHVGSEGGYVAVRNNHKKAPHAHLVEHGHNNVTGGKLKLTKKDLAEGKKKGKIVSKEGKKAWTNGRFMYRNAMNELEDELMQEAEELAERLVEELF